jgi:hypothetical protein
MAGGRPSKFKADYAQQAEKLCDLGATDEDLADFFDVSIRTIANWKSEHPEFLQALKGGKSQADDRVERRRSARTRSSTSPDALNLHLHPKQWEGSETTATEVPVRRGGRRR